MNSIVTELYEKLSQIAIEQNISFREISRRMGKNPTFVSSTFRFGNPRMRTIGYMLSILDNPPNVRIKITYNNEIYETVCMAKVLADSTLDLVRSVIENLLPKDTIFIDNNKYLYNLKRTTRTNINLSSLIEFVDLIDGELEVHIV